MARVLGGKLTVAICVKCGARKHGSWTRCQACSHSPFGEDEVAWSVILSDHNLSDDQLQKVSKLIATTGKMPAIDPDFWNSEIASVRASAKSLAKMGLLVAPEEITRKTLLVSSVANTAAARFWRSIRLFDIRLYHPDASVPISITAEMFEPTVILLASEAFAKSEDCMSFLAEIRRERHEICFVRLDDIEPRDLGIETAGIQTFEVQSKFGHRRFRDWLKKFG
jgi:hypothetical protein